MAKAAQADSIRSDRQHQQTLSGHLLVKGLEIELGTEEPYNPSSGQWLVATGPWKQPLKLKGTVVNVGNGPALAARIFIRFPQVTVADVPFGMITLSRDLGVFAPGERAVLDAPGGFVTLWTIPGLSRPLQSDDLPNLVVRVEWTTLFRAMGWAEYEAELDMRFFRKETVHPPDYVPIS